MDRRLLFPAVAAVSWAQQVSPEAAEAEKAVRARAEKFFQLEVDKNFRGAWRLVADDTQDLFFDGGKPNLQGFTVEKVELSDNNTRATVTIKAKVMMIAPGMPGQVFDVPDISTWKFENGDWFWHVDQSDDIKTPFGTIKKSAPGATGGPGSMMVPDLASIKNQVSIDRRTVSLSDAAPVQTVTITNQLPGPVTVEVGSPAIKGLEVTVDNKRVATQQKGTISFRAMPGTKPQGTIGIDIMPLGEHFDIAVSSK